MLWSLKHSVRAIVTIAALAFGSSLFVACGSSADSLLGSSSIASAKGTPSKSVVEDETAPEVDELHPEVSVDN